MKRIVNRMIREDDGVLSFEWTLMITVLVIGVVSGLTAARDAIVDEIGDAAEAIVALDQTYVIDFPLMSSITNDDLDFGPATGGGSDSGFTDFSRAFDCTRGNNVPNNGQEAERDEN